MTWLDLSQFLMIFSAVSRWVAEKMPTKYSYQVQWYGEKNFLVFVMGVLMLGGGPQECNNQGIQIREEDTQDLSPEKRGSIVY